MASKKGGGGSNFRSRFSSLNGAGGDHPEKGSKAIIEKGRVSIEEKTSKATGKENPNIEINRNKKEFKPNESPITYDQYKAKQSKNEPEKEM